MEILNALVAAGVPPATAETAAAMADAGMAIASILTFFSGMGIAVGVLRTALRQQGKKAIAA
ncbi:hypothetical protein KJC03_12795 [Mammaliicoccus sciuri]|uniref:hypothetical protein n=1 Tax=Mammaliicoccus sciuri TaxID=1296 RepID=UPI000D1D6AED|nr:hypothetical protein [Mammaliicoccus sciuri]MCE5041964.1 hypothetical protein [Mammaliicoccus sciuri]PTJ62207.1 hypothetical protein BUZ97_12180 [Mammaliicoccus sciuri]